VGKGKIKNKGEKMRHFKFFIFFLFLFSFLVEAQPNITNPHTGDFVRGTISIIWTGDAPPYTLKIFQPPGGAQVIPPISPVSSPYDFNTQILNNGQTEILIEDNRGGRNNVIVTIDNTPPNSNIQISGVVKKNSTINYGGTWSDISGISTIYKTELYADTDADTTNGGYVKVGGDLTQPETPLVVGTTSGTFTGSFTITPTRWDTIKNYRFIFVRIIIRDNAIDQNNENNETIDWSNALPVSPSPDAYPYITPLEPNGKISPKIAYPFAITDPEPAPGYIGITRDSIETGWYTTFPVLRIDPPNFPDKYSIVTTYYTIYLSVGDSGLTSIYDGYISGGNLTIDFHQFGDGRYKVMWYYYVKNDNTTPPTYYYTDYYWYPNETKGGFNEFGSSLNYICIDTTPPSSFSISIFVNKPPDGKWAILKDKGIMVQWYNSDPNDRPIVYFLPTKEDELLPSDTSSGIYPGLHRHSLEGDDTDPLLNYDFSTDSLEEVMQTHNQDVRDFLPETLPQQTKNLIKDAGWYFPVYNARGKKLVVGIYDRAGNIGYVKMHPLYWTGSEAIEVPLYVDTIPPRTRVEITTDDTNYLSLWPTTQQKDVGIPVDQTDPDDGFNRRWYKGINNIGFPRPEDATPPSGYPLDHIEHLFFASSGNSSRPPTKFRLIATDTPRYILTPFEWALRPGWSDPKYPNHYKYRPQYDQRFSDFSLTNYGSGVSDDFQAPRYRRSFNLRDDIRVDTEGKDIQGNIPDPPKWETAWQRSNKEYLNQSVIYEDVSPGSINDWVTITDWFMLPSNVTSLEYFSLDNAGNEEVYPYWGDFIKNGEPVLTHHLIVDEGGGLVKGRILGDIGKSNMRADDNVPDPDINLSPSSYNGENGWYISPVTIELTYNDSEKWKDPLPTKDTSGKPEPGSGIKKFQYAFKNDGSPPNEGDFLDYTYGRKFTLTDGTTYIYYRAIDNLGNKSGNIARPYIPYENNPVRVDTVPPLTTINLSGANVTLTSSDVGSGVASISYRTRANLSDNTAWETVPYSSVSFVLPEGRKIVEYYAKDLAGNYEPLRTSNFGEQDTTPPTTYLTYTGPYYNYGTNTYITSELNTNPTRFSLTATDGSGTGIRTGYPKYKKLPASTEYSWTGTPFSLPKTSTGIEYWSKDVVGNEELPHKVFPSSGLLYIDDEPPSISFTRDKQPSSTGWYNSSTGAPTITITATDPILDSLLYDTSDGTPNTPATIPSFNLTLSSDGIYKIVAKASDKLGNTTQNINCPYNPVKVDLTPPISDLTPNNGIFTLTSSDATSGGKTMFWKIIYSDDNESQTYSYNGSLTTFTVQPDPIHGGIKSIKYWSEDNAGNIETERIWNSSSVDNTPPVTTITYSQPKYTKGNILYITSSENISSLLGKTQFTITSNDPLINNFSSGIAIDYPKYSLNGDPGPGGWEIYKGPFSVSSGDSSIYTYAVDAAGNEETPHKYLEFTVDDEPPAGTTITVTGENGFSPRPGEWFNSTTGRAKIIFTGTTDTKSGVKGVRYTIDGSEPGLNSNLISVDTEFYLDDVKIYAGNFKYAGVDNLENRENIKIYNQNIYVDTKAPTTTINVDYNKKTFTLSATDNGLSGLLKTEYSFDGTNWYQYNTGENVSIPSGTTKIYARSYDNAGNIEDPPVSLSIPYVKICGYVKDYKGNPVNGVKIMIGGEINKTYTTGTNGYFEFTNLNALGNYYIIPLIQNSMPLLREYVGIGSSDLREQNFIIMNGWMSKNYDRGNSNDYYYRANRTLPSNSKLIKEWTIGKGGDILTGDIEWDGKLDLIVKDVNLNSINVYNYNSATKQYDLKSFKSTNYNLSLIDSIDKDTNLEILLTGTGKNLFEIYDNQLNKLRTKTLSNPPDDTEWAIRFAEEKILLAGDGTNYETVILYDYLTDNISWETEISQKIIPENLNIFVRSDGKVMNVFAGESDDNDIVLYAIDVFTGNSVWTKKLTGIRGKLKVYVSDIDNDGNEDIIGVRTSTTNQFPLTCYMFNPSDGSILKQVPITGNNTEDVNVVISDIDADGIKEIIISDKEENVYVVNIINGYIENSKTSSGKVWGCVDFDGKADNNKEIIVSKGSYVKVLDSSLNELMSYNLGDTILRVIVSDINNDGLVEIITTSPTKTYILRPSTTSDLPNSPTNLTGSAGADGVYLSWNYISNGAPLSGFKIYRSIDGINWELAGSVSADKTFYKDTPSPGMWYYKVSAYNDYGEVYCSNPASILINYSGGVPSGGGGGGCFIASVCFGENSWQVKILKDFRDRFLLRNGIGRGFVRFYYAHSRRISEFLKDKIMIKSIVKISLYPVIIIAYLAVKGLLPFIFVILILPVFLRKF
jgi:hypothetical protein